MKDEQARRYARHLALPEVGGLGQTALLATSASLALRDVEPMAELICGSYLAAGGVGALVVAHATDAQRAELAAHGTDTHVVDGDAVACNDAREVALAPRPTWWPGADGDATALAFFRGAIAATRWMAQAIDR